MGKIFINVIKDQRAGDKKYITGIIKHEDANYVAIDDAYLRLRLDTHMDVDEIKLSKAAVGTCVDFRSGIIMGNARTNMNPFVIKSKTDVNNGLYIIVDESHKIMHYELAENTTVTSTFRSVGANVGAILSFNKSQKDILTLYTESNGKVFKFTFTCLNGSVDMKIKPVKDATVISEIKEAGKYTNNKFKVNITRPFTNCYIVSKNKEKELKGLLERNKYFGSKSPLILVVEKEDDLSNVTKTLRENKIKVVTEYGYLLPLDVIHELKLNGIFTMNKECKLNCLRSK